MILLTILITILMSSVTNSFAGDTNGYCAERMRLADLRGEKDVVCTAENAKYGDTKSLKILNDGLEVRSNHFLKTKGRAPAPDEVSTFMKEGGSRMGDENNWITETNRLISVLNSLE